MGNTRDEEKINYFHSDAGEYKKIVDYFDKKVDQNIELYKVIMDKNLGIKRITHDKGRRNKANINYLSAKRNKEKYEKRKANIVRGIRRTLKGTASSKGIDKSLVQKDVEQILKLGTLIATSETLRSGIAPHIAIANLHFLKRNQFSFADVFGTGSEAPKELGFIAAAKGGADAMRKFAEGKQKNFDFLKGVIDEFETAKTGLGKPKINFMEHSKKYFPHTLK